MSRVRFSSRCLAVLLLVGSTAVATPAIENAWEAKYPTSTLPARMEYLTGTDCHVCHHPFSFSNPGNCYREDLSALLWLGRTIEEAIDELDGADSDGDGVPNGVEATMPRADQAGEVGYNMGLIGDFGTDPCSNEAGVGVTGEPETPAIDAVPTVSEWGLIIITILFLVAGSAMFRRPQERITGRSVR